MGVAQDDCNRHWVDTPVQFGRLKILND